MPEHAPDVGLAFDPAEARKLLAQAGFPGGKEFPAVTIFSGSDHPEGTPRWLAEQWETHLGVAVDWQMQLELYPRSEFLKHEPSIWQIAWDANSPDPDYFLRIGVSRAQPTWRDEQYFRLLKEARQLADPKKRLALYRQAEHILIGNACIVPLAYEGISCWLRKPWVTRSPLTPMGYRFWKDVVIEPH